MESTNPGLPYMAMPTGQMMNAQPHQQQQEINMAMGGYQEWPQHQYQQQQQIPGSIPNATDEVRTIWVGDLEEWMNEPYLTSCFSHTGQLISAAIIRNKQTGQSLRYGFLEFASQAAAQNILQSYNGIIQMPYTQKPFRLNWASRAKYPNANTGPEYSIFVGDLAADVTDSVLEETFRWRYPSLKGAKVMVDRATGRPKGYGFVSFGDENEQMRAMTEMNGSYCSSRPMRIGPAASDPNRNKARPHEQHYNHGHVGSDDNDPNNTTVFVGGLDPSVSCEDLKQYFAQIGEVANVKIPVGKRCGFVEFGSRTSAEEALVRLNGTTLGQHAIRLSWGRNQANKQQNSTYPNQNQYQYPEMNGGYYGYGQMQGYEAAQNYATQDPNMFSYGSSASGNGQPQGNYYGAAV